MKASMTDAALAGQLQALLRARGMTQKELARQLGMGYQSVTRLIKGKRPMYATEIGPVCRALQATPEQLLELEA